MPRVYVVQHEREPGNGAHDVKFVGVYSNEANALAAVAKLRSLPGFRDFPDGFHVDEYQLDRDQWIEGFTRED